MKRVGLIGLGHVARHHINGINSAPGLTLAATADLRPRPADVGNVDCPHFLSLDQMLDEIGPDILVIATPPDSHLPLVQDALRFGVDVLLEKPATPTRAAFDTLQELARGSSHRVDVALHAAYGREMLWVQDEAADLAAQYGPPTGFLCQFRDPYVVHAAITPAASGLGGSWRDSGINALSVLDRILPLAEATVESADFVYLEDVDIRATVRINWPGGTGRIETDWGLGQNLKRTELTFAGGAARLMLHHSGEYIDIQDAKGSRRVELGNTQERLTNHYIALFDAYANPITRTAAFGAAGTLHQLLFDALDPRHDGRA